MIGALWATTACASSTFGLDSCADLGEENDRYLSDKQLFVQFGGKWIPFATVPGLSLPKRTSLNFAVVIQPSSGLERSGVVIVKSNRVAKIDDKPDMTKNIWLLRRHVQADPACRNQRGYRALREVFEESVSTTAYEDYHDYPAKDTEALRAYESKLKEFHFLYYSGVKGRCIGTDDINHDEYPNVLTSNRSQFSFDDFVVNRRRYTFNESFPSKFDGFADHKTLVKRYQTVNGIACVGFKLDVDPEEYIIKVNDLEGRESPPSNRRQRERHYP